MSNSQPPTGDVGHITIAPPPKYRRIDNGNVTTADDPEQGVWYGLCAFWTDDWSQLKSVNGMIPCCPTCGSVGFQTTFGCWMGGARDFDSIHPRYVEFLESHKAHCFGRKKLMDAYKEWLSKNGDKQ
jgi:hypothetical protein